MVAVGVAVVVGVVVGVGVAVGIVVGVAVGIVVGVVKSPVRIEEIFAFIASNSDGEGVVGMMTPSGWMPLVGADMKRVESLRPFAKAISKESGQKIRLLKFSVREDLGEV